MAELAGEDEVGLERRDLLQVRLLDGADVLYLPGPFEVGGKPEPLDGLDGPNRRHPERHRAVELAGVEHHDPPGRALYLRLAHGVLDGTGLLRTTAAPAAGSTTGPTAGVSEDNFPKLSEIAPTVATSFEDWRLNVRQVADSLGRAEDGEKLVERTDADIAATGTCGFPCLPTSPGSRRSLPTIPSAGT